ncbi:MAG: redoxin domain-containing protein [Bacteroidales bacterium]|nr:redoxin domain-containing protein [Bacteroidales bacterium]
MKTIKSLSKVTLAVLCLVVSFMADGNAKTTVWEQPYYAKGRWWQFRITRIEFSADETVVTTEFAQRKGSTYRFDSTTVLIADSVRYALRSIDEFGIGQTATVQTTEPSIAHLHFAPVPSDVKKVDFYSKDGIRVWGLRDHRTTDLPLFPSHWRNTKTGDWTLGLLPECAIYANRFWDYVEREEKGDGQCTLRLRCDGEELVITIGPENTDNVRQIQIGQQKAIACNRILGRTLGEYPSADTRTKFVDNGYRSDTVTVRGWVRSKSKSQWKTSPQFDVEVSDILNNSRPKTYAADLDSLGRFTLQIPLRNSQEVYNGDKMNCVLEPGHDYLYFIDYENWNQFFMGDDCRLQNEMLLFPTELSTFSRTAPDSFSGVDEPEEYLARTKSEQKKNRAKLDSIFSQYPNLSARTKLILEENTLHCTPCRDILLYRFKCKNYKASKSAIEFVQKNYWTTMLKPYSLHRFSPYFFDDIISVFNDHPYMPPFPDFVKYGLLPHPGADTLAALIWNDENNKNCPFEITRKNVEKINAWHMKQNQKEPEKAKMVSEYYAAHKEAIEKARNKYEYITIEETLQEMVGTQEQKDIIRARYFTKWQRHDNNAYDDGTLDGLLAKIQTPGIREFVQGLRDKHEALAKMGTMAFISSGKEVNENSGEGLLNKITEPYRGRWILLDIWGLWCAPCCAGLKRSKEEFERFADLNLVYLYLANRSDQASMETFLKECGVTGENCVCYNLPADKQSRIENFLSVSSWPSYFLIDPQGRVLEKRVDPRFRQDEIIQLVKGAKN